MEAAFFILARRLILPSLCSAGGDVRIGLGLPGRIMYLISIFVQLVLLRLGELSWAVVAS